VERNVQGTNRPGSETSTERNVQGTKRPLRTRNETSWERKVRQPSSFVLRHSLLPKITERGRASLALYSLYNLCYYRAMHYSAKRGIEIACRLPVSTVCTSVCGLSVGLTLVDHQDHIDWKS